MAACLAQARMPLKSGWNCEQYRTAACELYRKDGSAEFGFWDVYDLVLPTLGLVDSAIHLVKDDMPETHQGQKKAKEVLKLEREETFLLANRKVSIATLLF